MQISKHSLERINRYLLECNANHEGLFETSRRSDEILHEAHAAMADFLNASRPEEIIFGNNVTTLTCTFRAHWHGICNREITCW